MVCVTGAGVEVRFGVVFWALILVSDEEPDRCSESNPMFNSGLDLDQILFVSLSMECEMRKMELRLDTCGCSQIALAWSSSTQLDLDVCSR